MNLATWSIRNPIPTIILFALLSIAGIYSFRALPIADLPDLDLPTINITLVQPGAAPTQLETEVARRVEDSLATIAGIRHVSTSISDSRVQITAQFELEKKLSDALIETRNALDRIGSDLPVDLQPPTISAVTIGGGSILTYAVSAEHLSEEELSWYIDNIVSKVVLSVPGLGRFERVGGVEREVRIDVDPIKLTALGATASELSRALRNMQQESSGGLTQLGGAEQSIRTVATVRQASELAAMPIALSDGRQLRLDEVAVVKDTIAERTQIALLNGKPVVGFNLYRAKGFDETRIASAVKTTLDQLTKEGTATFTLVSSRVVETEEQYQGSMTMLYEGAILALLIVWWFLRDWRATLVAASALPLSILPAFAAMYLLDYSLNTLTLLALAVVVGILVDDSIVEIENIERHVHMGKPITQATSDAVTEIALAVVATTMTLVVVFAPTTMMPGVPGLLFKQFGWTAVIAVLSSLLVARLLTPMLAVHFIKPSVVKPGANVVKQDGALMTTYLRMVRWALTHRRMTFVFAIAIFIGSLALVPLLNTGLMPAPNSNYSAVDIELPPGTSLNTTLASAEITRNALADIPGIVQIFTTVGVQQSQADARHSNMTITFAPRSERASQSELENRIRDALVQIPGARFSVGGGRGSNMSLILVSDDSVALKFSADELVRELRGIKGLANISSTANLERPELIVRPNLQRAAELGVTSEAIGDTLRIATRGDFDSQLAKLNLDTRQIYIRTYLSDSVRQDINQIGNLHIPARNGLVPLSSVASISLESGPAQIERYDRKRFVTINAELGGTPLGEALNAARQLPSVKNMPSSVQLLESGDAELMSELMSGFGMAMIAGLLCVYCVLVLLFKDFLQPVTILSAIPLSICGAFVALLLANSELDVPSMIGLIMLMGIVTKNSILLVEYAIMAIRDHGLDLHAALIDACHKRARPIVMTTMAMIAGMLPIALGFGADASFRQPMAIAVIGGLITSTALSLLIVPVVFTYMDSIEKLFKVNIRSQSVTVEQP